MYLHSTHGPYHKGTRITQVHENVKSYSSTLQRRC